MKTAQTESYRNFVQAFAVLFFVFPALLGFFNYSMDPNHRYRFSVAESTLKKLAASPDLELSLPANYDDRALLKKFIPLANQPEIVVIGGSRIKNIQAEMFKEPFRKKFLNSGITAGTIRDYVALWQMMKQNHFRPKVVFLCMEEQSLNSVSQNDRYLSIYEFYEAFFERGLSLRVRFMGLTTDFKDLLSLQTTLLSFSNLGKPKEKIELVPKGSRDTVSGALTSSFSFIYPVHYENRGVDVIAKEGNANGQGELKVFQNWNRLDRSGMNQLEALIADIQKNGGTPVLIGMPYHPEAMKVLSQNPKAAKNLAAFVEDLKRLADKTNTFFYDGITAHPFDFHPEDFLDGVHLKMVPNYHLFQKVDAEYGLSIVDSEFSPPNA